MAREYSNLEQFYVFYKKQHAQTGTRVLHFLGTSLFLVMIVLSFIYFSFWLLLVGIFLAYGMAWIGHFFIEKNKPATFQYPWYSLVSDFKLYFEIIIGKEHLIKD